MSPRFLGACSQAQKTRHPLRRITAPIPGAVFRYGFCEKLHMKNALFFLLFLAVFPLLQAQQSGFSAKRLRVHFGFSPLYSGRYTGMGYVYGLGWEKSISRNGRWRIHPYLQWGEEATLFITDVPDAYFRTTELGLSFHYDLIRISLVSLVTSAGIAGLYERGMGGRRRAMYAHLFAIGNASFALRWDNSNKQWAYMFTPIVLSFGSDHLFRILFFRFSVIYKFQKRD